MSSCLRLRYSTKASATVAAVPARTMPRLRSAVCSSPAYRSARALKPRSNVLKIAPCSCGTRNTFAHNIGVSVSATNPDSTTAPATAMPNSLSSRPVEPRRNPSGVNTATRAIVVAITAKPISPVPRIAACSGASHSSSWCRYAFSSTMTASSTTMPIAMVSASRVKLLIE